MELNREMLQKILSMDDAQLSLFVQKLAKGSGIDPTALGFDASSMKNLRTALGSATNADLDQLNQIYRTYLQNQGR